MTYRVRKHVGRKCRENYRTEIIRQKNFCRPIKIAEKRGLSVLKNFEIFFAGFEKLKNLLKTKKSSCFLEIKGKNALQNVKVIWACKSFFIGLIPWLFCKRRHFTKCSQKLLHFTMKPKRTKDTICTNVRLANLY